MKDVMKKNITYEVSENHIESSYVMFFSIVALFILPQPTPRAFPWILILNNIAFPGEGSPLPAWLAFDRQVLSFDAFFQEAVVERREEQFRVRECKIYFYLEDDSIQVNNSIWLRARALACALCARKCKTDSDRGERNFIVINPKWT